ncbi:MAG: hypothetical protein ACTSQP_16805 [Promethearchaeota archaeon]
MEKKIKGIILSIFLCIISLNLILSVNHKDYLKSINHHRNLNSLNNTENKESPKTNLAYTNYEWWNNSWEYRIQINISANGASQNNVPIEIMVNFTEYLKEIGKENIEFDKDSIRVIEYKSLSKYTEIPCQFEPYNTPHFIYNNISNAVGDLIWIMNGTTAADATRHYFVYFNSNESSIKVPPPNYPKIRLWHEGFEWMEKSDGKILSAAGSGQDLQPNYYDISKSVSARGNRSLNIWGNCWKAIDLGFTLTVDSNIFATAKIRIDDPSIVREISGIAFQRPGYLSSLPAQGDTYEIRGSQNWGRADAPPPYGPYDDNYYAPETFFWYTFDLSNEVTNSIFRYIYFVADDDSTDYLNIYWDDISIWNRSVQTDPSHMPLISIGSVEPVSYSLKIICVDIDGFRVSNAHVYISNNSQPFLNKDDYTNSEGEVIFTNVSRDGIYNITVEYTQQGVKNPKTKIVYFEKNYKLTELMNVKTIRVNLWTINFNVYDRNNNPLEYGYILLYNNTELVGNASLNNGYASLIWINQSSYNYSVYMNYNSLTDESIYNKTHLKIFNGTVNRNNANSPKYNKVSEIIDTEAEVITGGATQDVRAIITFTPQNGKYFSEFNITAYNINDYIISINIEAKIDNIWNLIDSFTDAGEHYNKYSFEYNYTKATEVKITIIKENYQASNGTVNFTYVESTDVNINTKLSTIMFNITDQNLNPLENAIVKVFNETSTPTSDTPVARLKINNEGFAYYYGLNNETRDWGNYTILISFAGSYRPFGYKAGVWIPNSNTKGINITLQVEMNISLSVNLNINDYKTNLTLISQNPGNFLTQIYWRDNISIKFNFTTIDLSGGPPGVKSLETPDSIQLFLLDEDFGIIGNPIDLSGYEISTGIFNFTFNTSTMGLKGGYSYNLKIVASKTGYSDPEPLIKAFNVLKIKTQLTLYNSSTLESLDSYTITRYWNTSLKLILYVNETESGKPVDDIQITYSWKYGSGSVSENIVLGKGYYNFSINTGIATDTSTEIITFSFSKENYDTPTMNDNLKITIINRPSILNGEHEILYISKKIYVKDAYNFTFNYKDYLTSKPIINADDKSFTMQKLDENGNPIEGESVSGYLNELGNGTYILDLNTETLEVGKYFVFLTLDKKFYDDKDAILDLQIEKRKIDTTLSSNFKISNNKIEVIKGDVIKLTLELSDPTKNGIPLTNVTIKLILGDEEFSFKEKGDGLYELSIDTDNYDAFFTAQTLTGQITIEKEDYNPESIEITIVINMEEGPIPGLPTFYFLMIVGAILAVVISLVSYNLIQKARIPKFIKKVREMKTAISKRKSISESLLYPSKEEMMVKKFGELWEELDLSLEDILGIGATKGKPIKSISKTEEGGAIE